MSEPTTPQAERDVLRLLAGAWYLDASSDPAYEDLFERGWLRRLSAEPGDYALTDAGQTAIDAILEKLA